MLKYHVAAFGLKLFSTNGMTRRAYRSFGNRLGARRRGKAVQSHYFRRADDNLRRIEAVGGVADGMQLVELGTGWMHWEALFTRLFYDVRVILFDVWDNRQFPGFLHYAGQLRQRLAGEVGRDPEAIARAEALLDQVLACKDFDAVYALLGFSYLIDETGSLRGIADGSVDLVISSDVLEHVPRAAMPTLARDFWRILKPGGRTAHQIVYVDHLTIYERSVHPKNYLRKSDTAWKMLYENDVQYINRLQPSDFKRVFREAGFEIEAEAVLDSCDVSHIAIAEPFRRYPRAELETNVNHLIVRKPV